MRPVGKPWHRWITAALHRTPAARVAAWLAHAALLLATVATPAEAQRALEPPAPGTRVAASGDLMLDQLPAVLDAPEIEHHLTTGLTAALVFQVDLRGGGRPTVRGGASVEVRYELWDEVFRVRVVDRNGPRRVEILDSLDALRTWWKDLDLVVAPFGDVERRRVRTRFSLVPFSESERRDAERWYTDAVRPTEGSAGDALTELDPQGLESFAEILDRWVATAIRRPALLSHTWKTTVSRHQAPGRGGPA